ncbi:MAG: CehA/McbA family metallohydrolase [Calditrichaceae bacterium]
MRICSKYSGFIGPEGVEELIFPIFLPPVLYAETHYRFRYFFSLLKKPEPEIIADVPHRILRDGMLPVLLIVRDAHLYPVVLETAEVFIDNVKKVSFTFSKPVDAPYFESLLKIDVADINPGQRSIIIKIEYKIKRKTKICFNDNHRGTTHEPFPCYFSDEALPNFEGYALGEPHAHTNFTYDQIEFGASIQNTAEMARILGLRYFAATDHSYDLDDMPDNYFINDPELRKWHDFHHQVSVYNDQTDGFCVIPGEEVSARNSKEKNVHLLVYNSDTFYHGTGDSGDRWLNYRSEHDLSSILKDLNGQTVAFAAHPKDPTPFLQSLLLNRGGWNHEDAAHNNLTGVQIINGRTDEITRSGLTYWKELLLAGHKIFALAGDDAHGNFGRYRQIAFPFVSMREHYRQLFGTWRTGIFLGKEALNVSNLITGLRSGNYFMTNGPAIRIQVIDGKNIHEMGMTAAGGSEAVLQVKSGNEYGGISRIRLFYGIIGDQDEITLLDQDMTEPVYSLSEKVSLPDDQKSCYIRGEAVTKNKRGEFYGYTNPIWIQR